MAVVYRSARLRRKKFRLLGCEGLEPRGGDGEVPPHRFARRIRVPGRNRARDRPVFGERGAKLSGRRHGQPAHPFQMDAQRVEDISGAGHLQTIGQGPVERNVERVVGRMILGGDRRVFLFEVRGERVLSGGRHPAGGFGGDLAFERAADEQALARILKRDPRDERPVLGRDVDQTIISEAADGGGNGKAGNAEPFAQSRLVDQAAGLKRPGENRFLEIAVHGVRLRMRPLRQFPPRHSGETLRLCPLTC